jgi:hypothetical protein
MPEEKLTWKLDEIDQEISSRFAYLIRNRYYYY